MAATVMTLSNRLKYNKHFLAIILMAMLLNESDSTRILLVPSFLSPLHTPQKTDIDHHLNISSLTVRTCIKPLYVTIYNCININKLQLQTAYWLTPNKDTFGFW